MSPRIHQTSATAVATNSEDWRADALCRQTDPDAFFPEVVYGHKAAKRVCAACPVTTQCLKSAIDNNERFGIWGGLSTPERDRLAAATDAPKSASDSARKENEKRVIAMANNNRRAPEIARTLGICERTTYRIIRRYKERSGAAQVVKLSDATGENRSRAS